jgi:hypothetical protein
LQAQDGESPARAVIDFRACFCQVRRRPIPDPTMRGTLLAAGLLALLFVSPAAAEKRVALVVGNSTHQSVSRLESPKKRLSRGELRMRRTPGIRSSTRSSRQMLC